MPVRIVRVVCSFCCQLWCTSLLQPNRRSARARLPAQRYPRFVSPLVLSADRQHSRGRCSVVASVCRRQPCHPVPLTGRQAVLGGTHSGNRPHGRDAWWRQAIETARVQHRSEERLRVHHASLKPVRALIVAKRVLIVAIRELIVAIRVLIVAIRVVIIDLKGTDSHNKGTDHRPEGYNAERTLDAPSTVDGWAGGYVRRCSEARQGR